MTHMFDEGLGRRDANYVPLTPIDFIARAAEIYGEYPAVVYGETRRTWRETSAGFDEEALHGTSIPSLANA